ncbi:3'-5' exonuclease [Lipingzhangella sp. LS1_29]|uniref:3'-5' exonuclease n=1 Tax=Lipingzhangella rawalii TaxID=2055835 RepID=A0ABU2H9I6_9ACTN|nr:3'-5' exonuclease [Lipingzhangella rawalii]MDS1271948.1 3'-5' exonuclease [Lipingzhangella rawalii]
MLHDGWLRRSSAGHHPRALEYAVVDVETTGLDVTAGARVCEIAVVRLRGDGTVVEEFATLVDPRAPVTGREFHGIGDADVRGAPRPEDLVGELTRLMSGAVIVGHNLAFEEQFLAAEFVPVGLPPGMPGLCTLRALRAHLDLPRYSLPRASYALSGRWPSGQHTALGDARATAHLLAELLYNAPGPLSYVGALPGRRRSGSDTVGPAAAAGRYKPRLAGVGHGLGQYAGPGTEQSPRLDLRRWPAWWRPLELAPQDCGGRFGSSERARALAGAQARSRRHVALTTAVGWAVGAASIGTLVLGTWTATRGAGR